MISCGRFRSVADLLSASCPQAVRELSAGYPWAVRRHIFSWKAHDDYSNRLSVYCRRAVCGMPVGYPWSVRGLTVDCPRAVRGSSAGFPWAVRGLSVGCPRFRGLSAGCPWTVRRLSVSYLWPVHRLFMTVRGLFVHGLSADIFSHGNPMMILLTDCPWAVHRLSAGYP